MRGIIIIEGQKTTVINGKNIDSVSYDQESGTICIKMNGSEREYVYSGIKQIRNFVDAVTVPTDYTRWTVVKP